MSCIWDSLVHFGMSHFWPFCFLISPSLKHIHLCCVLFPRVFRGKWAAISCWPPLFCTQDSFFSTVSTPPLHVRVWGKKKNFWYFPIFTPNYYNPFSNLLYSLKRYTAVDWEAVWSYWSTQTLFFFHEAWPADCRSQAMSTQSQVSAGNVCIIFCLDYAIGSLMKVFCVYVSTEEMSYVLNWFWPWYSEFLVWD